MSFHFSLKSSFQRFNKGITRNVMCWWISLLLSEEILIFLSFLFFPTLFISFYSSSNSLFLLKCLIEKNFKFLLFYWSIVDVQFSSVAQLCLTLCDPMDCSMPGFPVHHQLTELAQTQVHWVNDAIQPHLILCCPFSSCPQLERPSPN